MSESSDKKELFLAHSQKRIGDSIISPQSYEDHLNRVVENAVKNAKNSIHYSSLNEIEKKDFIESIKLASMYHDLGKLDEENQKVLKGIKKANRLPINHVDAGVAFLWKKKKIESAVLVYGHHHGLLSKPKEGEKPNELFMRDPNIKVRTDGKISEYLRVQNSLIPNSQIENGLCNNWSGLSRRIALSCLVDADYEDTARHYYSTIKVDSEKTRWGERIEKLDRYVRDLNNTGNQERNSLRSKIYNSCKNSPILSPIRSCDSAVGTGKTTAVMAYMLKVAQERGLRHIFVVLPYTNIIKQSVDIYRKALILLGENPEKVVAEHHHQADFKDESSHHLATLWDAPIIVTTAVQFFETIAGCNPAKIRKMHQLPGSAVFIDEAHAAIPVWQWPQHWIWLKELSDSWSCNFVFASGSLSKFWELNDIVLYNHVPENGVPDIVSDAIRKEVIGYEKRRICFESRSESRFNRASLIKEIENESGPRLVIMNTVQSTAVLANEMKNAGYDVFHLSTSLAPLDRNRIIEKIKARLTSINDSDWTLIATSCVEAGMDFSFVTAFRESCSVASLIQTGGRVNRNGEMKEGKVIDFRVQDCLFNENIAFNSSRRVLSDLFTKISSNNLSPSEAITVAIENEIKLKNISVKKEELLSAERDMNYPDVAKLCRVIDSDTKLVVVNKSVTDRLMSHLLVSPHELIMNSVRMWDYLVNKLALKQINNDLFTLGSYEYDPDFLGYMKGVLPQIYAKNIGGIII